MYPGVTPAVVRLIRSGEVLMFMSSSLQGGPHFLVALIGPDHGIVDPRGFVERARDVERQAVLVDRKLREFRIHHLAGHRHGLLEVTAPGDPRFLRAIT